MAESRHAAGLEIVDYRASHHAVFRDLNAEWIGEHFMLEDRDHRELDDPERYLLANGGKIFVAELGGVPVGTCALLRGTHGAGELAKLAVARSARGYGVGRALTNAVIAHARALGLAEIELFTNPVLAPALRLYRSLGFVEAPFDHSEYTRATMRMVLALGEPTAVHG